MDNYICWLVLDYLSDGVYIIDTCVRLRTGNHFQIQLQAFLYLKLLLKIGTSTCHFQPSVEQFNVCLHCALSQPSNSQLLQCIYTKWVLNAWDSTERTKYSQIKCLPCCVFLAGEEGRHITWYHADINPSMCTSCTHKATFTIGHFLCERNFSHWLPFSDTEVGVIRLGNSKSSRLKTLEVVAPCSSTVNKINLIRAAIFFIHHLAFSQKQTDFS